jgi:hypothetical protein
MNNHPLTGRAMPAIAAASTAFFSRDGGRGLL